MSPRKHLLPPPTPGAPPPSGPGFSPCAACFRLNNVSSSPRLLPPEPLTCLHRLKMWCWNMRRIKQRRTHVSDEGDEDSNVLLSLLRCVAETRGGGGEQVWWMSCRDTRTFLPVFTCLWWGGRGGGAIYLAWGVLGDGGGWGGLGRAIQSEDVCRLTGGSREQTWHSLARGDFRLTLGGRTGAGRGQNGKVSAGRAGVTWCIVG